MTDTAQMIRKQMDETKLQLSDKLASLEHQVSETVQSTGTAVNATVEAVQETVETVTEAARDTVQYVSRAFDFPRHVERHPWLALGGSVALGYWAAEFLARSKKPARVPEAGPVPHVSGSGTKHENGKPEAQPAATDAALAAAYGAGSTNSFWREMRTVAIGALFGIAKDVVSRAVPPVMDYLVRKQRGDQSGQPTATGAAITPAASEKS
jgi:hypothetical protein